MQSVDTVIHARWIAPVEPAGVLENHALVVRDGRVVDCLPGALADSRYLARERLERTGHLLLPGFVNAEVDLESTLWRGAALARPRHFPGAPADASAEALADSVALGCVESLLAGITTSASFGHAPAAVAAGVAGLNARAVLAVAVDETHGSEEAMATALRLHDEFRDHPLIRTAFVLKQPARATAAHLTRLRVLADQLERPVFIEATGADHAGLHDAGLWHPGTTLLGYPDLPATAAAGVAVVHRPAVDLEHRRAPVPLGALAIGGTPLALGTGRLPGARDPLELLRLTARLNAGSDERPALPPAMLLRMATLGGAIALGLEDSLGSLGVGKRADFVRVALDGPAAVPVHDPLVALIDSGHGSLVTDVWIGGRAVVAERRVRVADADEIVARAAARRATALSSATPSARQ